MPIDTALAVDTSPISTTPPAGTDLDPIWSRVVPETRARSNDIHLPISLAYAERLCAAHPEADALVVRVAILLHDTGWGRVDEERILSEGFSGDWRKADIRYEHERQGCLIAEEVLPELGYDAEFVGRVTAIIDGHDTRPEARSLEDALVRDADRLWRFDQVGIALASSWFKLTPSAYMDRLETEIVPELQTSAARQMAEADLARSRALLKASVLR
ncbi:HD domain-containing protein [Kocuria sp. LUK]|uniref:HD domain-containing protein n=1 Tax=Kocuria sp. LUK TaxID=2897828 RepID=UPI001E4E066F|nr:HD domain-containing protein [Kocuria sp. LUK]MCD1144625.1 HD domain-containing protein [Kocuria sp. LUK]